MIRYRPAIAFLAVALLLASCGHVATLTANWTPAFSSSPASYAPSPWLLKMLNGRSLSQVVAGTVRYTFPVAVGGHAVRIRLTNEEGTEPLRIQAATVALADAAADTTRGDIKPLTFHGQAAVTIAPGAPVISDPTILSTAAMDNLVVSVYIPVDTLISASGGASMTLASGDQTQASALQDGKPLVARPFVSGAAVETDSAIPVVVAFGDSLTDGLRHTPQALHGYPEALARRFVTAPAAQRRAVINAGIGGNRMLLAGSGAAALARLDRDVLRIQGVSHMILLEGINDIGNSGEGPPESGPPLSADDLIAGYRQIILRAHARGVKVIGGTLMPFRGAFYYSATREATRLTVNHWIRTAGEFDGVIDFEAIVGDPADPTHLRPEFDSGDHLHPNDRGYQTMGDAIDLRLFR